MFNVIPATKNAGGIPDPITIFPSSLIGHWDARLGITTTGEPTRVTNWANQGSGGDFTDHGSAANRPTFVASGSDGTAEVDFEGASDSLLYADSVEDAWTAWVLIESVDTSLGALFYSDAAIMGPYVQGLNSGLPSIFTLTNGWLNGTESIVGWHVTRFTADRGVASGTSIAVDDNAEETFTATWTAGQVWTYVSRALASHQLDGPVKQIILVDEVVDDADSRHQDVLNYFKDVYPTLVTY